MCKIFDLSEIDDINNVLDPRVCQKQQLSGGHPIITTRGQNTIIIIVEVRATLICNKEFFLIML